MGLLCVLLLTSYRLRVYFRIMVMEVEATRINPDGSRLPLLIPPKFHRALGVWATESPEVVLEYMAQHIRAYTRRTAVALRTEPGTRFEWVIRYSQHTTQVDQQRVLIVE
jgi:hypothetical protein